MSEAVTAFIRAPWESGIANCPATAPTMLSSSWCGYLSCVAANRDSGLACVVGYYRGGITGNSCEKRKAPTLLHFGENDPLIPLEDLIQFRAQRPDVTAFAYPAGHGFNCEERDSYSQESAARAFDRTLFMISQYVDGQPPLQLKNSGAYLRKKRNAKRNRAPW